MATENNAAPASYGQQSAAELPANPASAHNGANGHSSASTGAASNATSDSAGPSKDEVGWAFVEQYYTTMSKSPERLHLFYTKKSQFLSGVEAKKVSVSVGQKAINEKIKELEIDDCLVRVTNVDSQESHDKSILVQVIGEMSNSGQPHKKFVQTFVLAKQNPNGYFVLNDIFRYIAEEDDDEDEQETADTETETTSEPTAASAAQPATQAPASSDPVAEKREAEVVDKELEKTAVEEEATPEPESPSPAPAKPAEPTEQAKDDAPASKAESEATTEDLAPEAPKDPEPAPKPAETAAPKEPAAPPKPAAPKTWASLIGGGKAAPAVPNIGSSTPSKKPATPTPAANSSAPAPAAAAAAEDASQPLPSPGGWQTAGGDHGKRQHRPQNSSVSGAGQQQQGGKILGYVKGVNERVDADALRASLEKHGRLEYFDVSRQKNCAFVEFATWAGYHAAVAANPHRIGGEEVVLEERRAPRQGYGGGGSFGRGQGAAGARGGAGGRGGPGGAGMENRTPSGGRGGFKGERGGFRGGRGGGGNVTPRGGRGMTQTA